MNDWQWIETAPKDGTWFLGYYESVHSRTRGKHLCVVISWYDPCAKNPDLDPKVNRATWEEYGPGSHYSDLGGVTHWMPLPEPPK